VSVFSFSPQWQAHADSSEGGAFQNGSIMPKPLSLKGQSQKSVIPAIKTIAVKMLATRFLMS
jgi:hypothetical protein